jgi:hypothetical protein
LEVGKRLAVVVRDRDDDGHLSDEPFECGWPQQVGVAVPLAPIPLIGDLAVLGSEGVGGAPPSGKTE